MDVNGIFALTVEGLKGKLAELGLPTNRRNSELRDRLMEYFGLSAQDADLEYIDVTSPLEPVSVSERSIFTLRRIADSLTSFCDTDNMITLG